jgi:hypothetical protein
MDADAAREMAIGLMKGGATAEDTSAKLQAGGVAPEVAERLVAELAALRDQAFAAADVCAGCGAPRPTMVGHVGQKLCEACFSARPPPPPPPKRNLRGDVSLPSLSLEDFHFRTPFGFFRALFLLIGGIVLLLRALGAEEGRRADSAVTGAFCLALGVFLFWGAYRR